MSDFGFASTATDLSAVRQTLSDLDIDEAEIAPNRRLPRVGEVVNELYEIEAVRGLKRYLVRHRGLQESFELRILNWVSTREGDLATIQQRARGASLVGNANTGVTVDVGACRSFGPYAVTDLVQGATLSQLLQMNSQFTVDEVVRLAMEIGAALGAIHEVGIAHGLVDLDDIVLDENGTWKLVGAGLPASPDTVWELCAPEIDDPEDVSVLSDQWAFSAVLYRMLVGHSPSTSENRAPSRRRSDVPEALDKAIMRGLRAEPSQRWATMEAVLETFQSGFNVWREPSMVPMDAREVSRLLKMHPDVTTGGFDRDRTRQSVVVRVANLEGSRSSLTVSFRNVARLRREYRHNLAHGGLFIPTTEPPNCGAEVGVIIELASPGRSVELDGVVTNVTEGSGANPPGVGVVFDSASMERMLAFLREVHVVRGLRASDLVVRTADFGNVDSLSAEELFLYSLVIGSMTVGDLRSECSSLPIDFEEMLQALVERNVLAMERANPTTARLPFRPSRPSTGKPDVLDSGLKLDADGLEFLLEQIEFHEERRALMAAAALVERGLAHLPDEPRLHHRRAQLLARGFNDLFAARAAARRALELSPKRREFQESLASIEALVERESIKMVYHRVFPVTDVHAVGWDARTDCSWILTRSRLQPDRVRILGIDTVRDTIMHSETHDEGHNLQFVWDAHVHAGGTPSVWEGARRPAAISPDGQRWAFERSPESDEPGMWVGDVAASAWDLLGEAGAEIVDAAFSPDGAAMMWTVSDPTGGTSVWLQDPLGSVSRVLTSEGSVRAFWNERGDSLTVFESSSGAVSTVSMIGVRAQVGTVRPGFTDVVTDETHGTAAILYDGVAATTAVWIEVATTRKLQTVRFNDLVVEATLRSDGCFAARTREGTILANFSLAMTRNLAGMRLAPHSLDGADWQLGEPLVATRMRPNALELVAFNIELLLA